MRTCMHSFLASSLRYFEYICDKSGLLYESPRGNQVDGLPRVVSCGHERFVFDKSENSDY